MKNQPLEEFLAAPANSGETWQGGIVPFSDLVGAPAPPADAASSSCFGLNEMAMVLWVSCESQLVHAKPIKLSEQDPSDAVMEAMLEFFAEHEFPYRPALIECHDRELADRLNELFHDSGTEAQFQAEMAEWNAVREDMLNQLFSAHPLPSLADVGCSEAQIREFAEASAAFYRAGLWDYLEDVDLIQIEAPKPPRNLKYAVVLGAASQTYGLGFYDDPEIHYDMMAQRADLDEFTLFSVTFGSDIEIAADAELWRELELPLETGDAFPFMSLFSPEEHRRPTPKELDFATVVLKALAATTEDELDSGRWTTTVELRGKSRKCTLSIPSLIEPPDRAEWIRRGMMPERRGNEPHFKLVQEFIDANESLMDLDELNEAINERFTGPLDELQFPMKTPADRAEALCYEAIDAHGRRRLQLARQALAEDPTHVEANVLVAESTRQVDRRIELFRRAAEHGKAQLGDAFQDAVGHFWGLTETRPYMRACQGLARSLDEAGQSNEAIEQFFELLRLNPNDNQGIRYEVMPVLLQQNREAEAIEILDRYPEETALWHYMQALIEFRQHGASSSAKRAMKAAFRANSHVVPLLESNAPPAFPDHYALGSPEEAAVCINELGSVWDESEDYLDWMVREYENWEKEKAKRLRERRKKQRVKQKKSKSKK